MPKNEKFHTKQGRGSDPYVQIGPRLPLSIKKDLEFYCSNTRQKQQDVIELALAQFLADKDLTQVVQLPLFGAIEITFNDPRFETLRALIERARTTTANTYGRKKLIERMEDEYRRLVRDVGMCVELKLEYEAARGLLTQEAET